MLHPPQSPRRGGPCGRPPSSFRPFLPVIPSPLPHVIPSPSRNLATPHSTSLHPTIPRMGGPCGRPPSSFRPFLPVIPSPLPHVIPSPSRNLAIPRSTSLHPTIPRMGGPCGRPPSSFRPFLPVIPSPCPMSFRVPRGISPRHAQRPYTQPFPVGAALVAALPLHSAPFCLSSRVP